MGVYDELAGKVFDGTVRFVRNLVLFIVIGIPFLVGVGVAVGYLL